MGHPGSGGSVGGVWGIRVGGASVFGGIERADRGICAKSCASSEVVRCTSVGCGGGFGFLLFRSPSCAAAGSETRHGFVKVLAFLAALGSPPRFSVFVLGTGRARA